jgi:dGTPase
MESPLYTPSDYLRIKNEQENRPSFRRDNGRLIHSSVFRRLQGKTQLFPCYESDLFRNRLSHSLEVAQIAKGIAENINNNHSYFQKNFIDLDLIETIALAHDIGHPPFGHNGEKALDNCMKEYGGFEGNAQTLRILSKIEKKKTLDGDATPVKNGEDYRCGLNLTYRCLASVLKYDNMIPKDRKKTDDVVKGFYYTELDIVNKIRKNIYANNVKRIKTIECQIMDVADDIAYSTYDLEDAFKAEFLSPIKMLATDPILLDKVAIKVKKKLNLPQFGHKAVFRVLFENYKDILEFDNIDTFLPEDGIARENLVATIAPHAYDLSNRICCDGYFRTKHTSDLVHEFMSDIDIKLNKYNPSLSEIKIPQKIRKKIEILKNYTYEAVIMSPRLKVAEYRGYEIVETIFRALTEDSIFDGIKLLPDDFQNLYNSFLDERLKVRTVCDFIAGMTDRYAVEFYARLKSENPQTIFKPF